MPFCYNMTARYRQKGRPMEQNTQLQRSQRMGTEPEGKLLLSMAVPMMLSMLVQALYNIVDSIYVSRVAEDCLTALSLAFPAQNILIGLATGTGVGVSTMVSRALGAGDKKQANRVAGNALFLSGCCWLLMVVFGVFAAKPFIHSQTTSESIRAYGDIYMQIVAIGSLFVYVEICFERLLQSTGQTKLSMWAQIIGAASNIILDPFFIFGWCGLPAMGTAGAAIATVLGQFLGALSGLIFHRRKNKELRLSVADFRPDKRIISEIYRIGFPSILMMGIGSITNYLMNGILIAFTSTAVAVYGAYFKLQSFFFMPVFGINNAMIPVIGFNYGAGKKERIYRTNRYAVLYAFCCMLLGFFAFTFLPKTLLGIFSPSEQMLFIGVPALRRICIHFPVAAFCIVAGSVCQALNKSMFSFISSILRQLVVLVPAAWLLSRTGDVNMIWWCFPIAEVMSAAANGFFLRRAYKDMERTLEARSKS